MGDWFDETTEDEADGWYEKALKEGYGFKSDKERSDYLKSLGFLSFPFILDPRETLKPRRSHGTPTILQYHGGIRTE
jgi:hypothetical protein